MHSFFLPGLRLDIGEFLFLAALGLPSIRWAQIEACEMGQMRMASRDFPGARAVLYKEVSSIDALIQAALRARECAYAPFSKFKVGAAIEDENGRVFTGCNIENATYGLTMCAERVAVFKAVSEGAARLKRVVVVTDTQILTPPCGACRQILWEFCGDADLILANTAGKQEPMSIKKIFPRPFDASFL